jgi:SpoIID/LytB domain protein
MRFRLKWTVLAFLLLVSGQPQRAIGELPKIRIGILRHRDVVSFSGPDGVTIQALRGGSTASWVPPGETWDVRADGSRVRVAAPAGSPAWSLARGVRLVPPEDGIVTISRVGDHWDGISDRDYRGITEVRLDRSGSLAVVNVVGIESYLRGVVPSEMPAHYPIGALRAQAVAARGQVFVKAGRHRSAGFDLCATQHCQVYGGATSEAPRSDQAVMDTWGQVLEYRRRVADTLYSSNCGGHTANNEDYWPEQIPFPYLRGGPDYDRDDVELDFPLAGDRLHDYLKYAPRVNCNQPQHARTSTIRWWSVVPRRELEESLTEAVGDFGELLDLWVTERADSGIVQEVAVSGDRESYTVRGPSHIRRALGRLNSATFAVEPIGEGDDPPVAFVIFGAGWGHQVGMCQVGAAGLADSAWDYRRILSKYYPGCQTVRRY